MTGKQETDEIAKTSDKEGENESGEIQTAIAFNTGSSRLQRNVQNDVNSKRKRIHMGAIDCSEHSASEFGAQPLVNPSIAASSEVDINRGLYPVIRHKRRKMGDANAPVSINSSQGFVSASKMYDIQQNNDVHTILPSSSSTSDAAPVFSRNNVKHAKKIKQIRNQGSILGFVSQKQASTPPSTPRKKSIDTSLTSVGSQLDPVKNDINNHIDDSQAASGRCVMYSPIKKLSSSSQGSVIYVSDSSPASSPCSSQSSQPSTQKSDIAENPVVKQLFQAQKTLDLTLKGKEKKRNGSANPPSNVKKKELEEIKEESLKYFGNDSFDFDKAFDSDMDNEVKNLRKTPSFSKENRTSDRYGLLGSGSYPKKQVDGVNYFELLPPEVLENIFCQLPMLDLCLNSNRVCKQWNDMIANDKFLPWKKLYHRLKAGHGDSQSEVRKLMEENNMKYPKDFLPALVRYMKDFKRNVPRTMLSCLQHHSKYSWAVGLIHERLTDCFSNQEPNAWCVITLLVILAHDVYDVQQIIRCLSVSSSECTALEILECLYCIATFLFAFKLRRRQDIWNGIHYRLFYALYLYENVSVSSNADLQTIMEPSRGQQSLVKYSVSTDHVRLTHEQLRIVKHQTGPHEVIKIVAFAGTGKTTTLVKYTQLRPGRKFLLVVYNKSVCEYAKTKFPPNVECRTGHSLAFKAFGMRYRAKLGNLKVYALTQALRARKGISLFVQAKFVLTTLENFFSSADPGINIGHVPDEQINEKTGLKEHIDVPTKQLLVQDAIFIWGRMQDFNEKNIRMTHDGYLKLYQLSRPRLSMYDCILIDEAQDLTPAITDILLHQRQGKILVGDPHQQIYSFRGAINAMNKLEADTVFYLTQSFRFGPEISYVAMLCLEVLKKERKKTLVGSGKKSTVNGETVGQVAIICRCNFTVFSEAVKKCCYSNEQCKVAFVGGTVNFGFPMLLDIYALTLSESERQKEGFVIKNNLIKNFGKFADLEKFATKSMDNELLGKIKIVKTYGHTLPLHIRKIESMCVRDERNADYVFSTAHKAKGLEFSTVRLTDDFLGADYIQQQVDDIHQDMAHDNHVLAFLRMTSQGNEDENNLLYVAVTRAKHCLQMSKTLLSVLQQAGERFLFPMLSEDLKKQGTKFTCDKTGQEFAPMLLTLQKQQMKLANGEQLGGQLYSPAYLSEDFSSYSQLLGLAPAESMSEHQ